MVCKVGREGERRGKDEPLASDGKEINRREKAEGRQKRKEGCLPCLQFR